MEHPSYPPLTCPFCGHELEDDAFIDEEDKMIKIDYSLNSPLCIASDMSFKNCKFHYLSSKKNIYANLIILQVRIS